MWLDVGDGQAALATMTAPPFDQAIGELPALILPAGVTGVWVASGLAAWPRPLSAALFYDRDGWQIVDPPILSHSESRLDAVLSRLDSP